MARKRNRRTQTEYWARDPVVAVYGGLDSTKDLSELEQVNWEIVNDLMTGAIADINKSPLKSELVDLQFHLVDSPDINAFVRVDHGQKLIGLCKGILCQLWNTLVTLIAHPSVLSDYFNDGLVIYESGWRNDLKIQLTSLKKRQRQPAYIPSYITSDRLELATLVYCCMVDYIVHHELAHLVRGHPDYVNLKYGLLAVEELPRNNARKNVRDVLNLLEIDADIHGVDLLVQHDPEFADLKKMDGIHHRNHLFIYIFPHLLLGQLFDIQNTPIAKQLRQGHPPPVYRSIIYSDALSATFQSVVGMSQSDAADEHNKAWYEASVCAKLLAFPAGRWTGPHMNDVDFGKVDEMRDRYELLSTQLDEHNSGA